MLRAGVSLEVWTSKSRCAFQQDPNVSSGMEVMESTDLGEFTSQDA